MAQRAEGRGESKYGVSMCKVCCIYVLVCVRAQRNRQESNGVDGWMTVSGGAVGGVRTGNRGNV